MSYTRGVKPEARMAGQSHSLATHSQTQTHMSHHLQQQATHRLVIKKQTSLAEEKLGQEGEQKLVHIVVKNTPFLIHLELQPLSPSSTASLSTSGNYLQQQQQQQQHTHLMDQDQHMHYLSLQSSLNFSNIHIDASLVYDSPDLKAVDFVRAKPLDFKAQPLDKPDSLTLETRIKVLTSQHEDMMFRIRISGLDVSTKKEIPGLDVITVPIKVVSKPDQAHRSKERSVSAANSSHNSASNSDSEAPPSSFPPCGAPSLSGHVTAKKKRSFQEFVQESLSRIEREQYEHRSIFAKLVESTAVPIGGIVNPNGNGYGCFESCVGSSGSTPSASPISSPFVTPYGSPSTDSLESSFSQFLHCLNRVDPAERPNKIRKLLASVHPTESETLHQVVETIRSDMPMTVFPNEYEYEYDSYGSGLSSRNATCNNSEISVEDAQYSMVDQYSYTAGFPAE